VKERALLAYVVLVVKGAMVVGWDDEVVVGVWSWRLASIAEIS
jgi:hypothetical protein